MFTKKTRVISAIVTLCMLFSLMASLVLPAAAAENYDEIVPATGLKDVSALPDIKNGLTGAKEYKVTDLDGIIKMRKLVMEKNYFSGMTIYLANDIDMKWFPVAPIGTMEVTDGNSTKNETNYIFSGTFDGNGFIFKDLYVMGNGSYGAGLFGNTQGATIKNVGIASGLVVGAGYTGSIVGLAKGGTKLINCWNAATVVGGGSEGVGGLVGQMSDGAGCVTNCYNLGLIYHYKDAAAGLIGRTGTASSIKNLAVTNSYSAGTVVSGFGGLSASATNDYYGAILRVSDASAETAVASKHNFYLNSIGLKGWGEKSGATVVEDGAAAVDAAKLAALATDLNKEMVQDSTDYTVEYTDSTAGFPVLTYKVGGSVVAKRLPTADAQNVVGNDWKDQSELFAAFSANAQKSFKPSVVEIKSANDLFVFGLVSSFNTMASNFSTSGVYVTADLDMKDVTMIGGEYFVPIASNGTMTFNMDGQGHTIYNWRSMAYGCTTLNSMGGFISCMGGGSLTNLSLENAHNVYELGYDPAPGDNQGYAYPSLLVERVNSGANATIMDCSATGILEINGRPNYNNNSGIMGRVWGDSVTVRNCWSETYVTGDIAEGNTTARAIGSSNTAANSNKFSNNYWFADSSHAEPSASDKNITGNEAVQTRITDGYSEELAVTLNEASDSALWTIKIIDGVKKMVRAADESETLAGFSVQRYIPTPPGYAGDPIPYGPVTTTYFMRGTEIELPALAGYEVDNAISLPVILNEDMTVNYYMIEPDFTYLDEAEDMMAVYDPDLFGGNSAEVFGNLETALDEVHDAQGDAAQIAAIYKVMLCCRAAEEFMANGELNAEYPNLPRISEYEMFASMGVTDWAVKSKEDWIYATNILNPGNAANLNLHLTNDIDMENVSVKPLAYGIGFGGTIDGHGYDFYNFNMTLTDTSGLEWNATGEALSFGLVSYLNSTGVIKNLGLASGKINITNVCSQEQGVAGFAGVAHGSSKIINCWNGLDIYATNARAANPSRVAGIVGRGYGTLYGCYNVGTVGGNNSYVHGLCAYGQNGNGKFYNCYNLPSATPVSNRNAAIGQGGSYQSNAAAPIGCYQNTYSVEAFLIWGYKNMSNPLVTELSESHTLTWDQYYSGEMAYTMNKDHVGITGADRVYWTLNEDGRTVHGTEANAVRKLTLKVNGEVLSEKYLNGNATLTVTHPGYDIKNVVVENGGAVISGADKNVVTMKGADVVISFDASCTHDGTVEYTYNNDGTHSWECTECHKGVENIPCSADTAWTEQGDGTHEAECVCGHALVESCYYDEAVVVNNADYHELKCKCGATMKEPCRFYYDLDGQDHHLRICGVCDKTVREACVMSDWTAYFAPTYDHVGEERKSCVCGRDESRDIPVLSGTTIGLSAPVAHAGETVEVAINLNKLPATGVSGFIATIDYDPAVFTYVENSLNSGKFDVSVEQGDATNGTLKLAFAGTANVTDGAGVATIKFKVAEDVETALSRMDISASGAECVSVGGSGVTSVTVGATFALVDVREAAWGDANGDKETTISDVVYLLRYLANKITTAPDSSANVADGSAIDTADAIMILRYLTGKYHPDL